MTHFNLNAHESAEACPDTIGAKHVPNNLKNPITKGGKRNEQ